MNKRVAKFAPDQSQKKQRIDSSPDNKQSEDNVDNGTVGKILSITLKNFMNHDNLKFDFSPNVNIIIGRNGSGKSAVVSGILLALGGKSHLTGRFSNLKGYIKTGKHTALLAVTLSNEGTSPYKEEMYGPKIIVERIITSDGSSSYKIKSHAGQIIATSKEELNKVLDCMKIQVDNPVSILTQENSRSFLDSKNPKDKYKFFFKATQLEKLYNNYVNAEQKWNDSEKLLKTRQEALPVLEKDIKKWGQFLETAAKIPEYENELIWSQVIEAEKKRHSVKKEYDVSERRVKLAEGKFKQSVEKYDKCCTSLDRAKILSNECLTEVNGLKNDISQLDIKMKILSEQKMELQGKINKVRREIMKNTDDIRNLQRSIDETREKSQQDVREEKRKRDEIMSKLQQELHELKQKESSLSVQQNQLAALINRNEKNIQILQYEEKEVIRQRESALHELQTLQNSVQDPVNIFGSYMHELLRNIDNAANRGHFIKKPIGPIARFVQVKNKKWTFAIEILLSNNLLRSFCCDNFDDRDKLTKMIQSCQPNNSRNPGQSHQIIVSKFLTQVHNTEKYRVQSHYPTVMDLIECTDSVVANCLIDQIGIESILLIENGQEAINLMLNNPPRNCSSTYLPNGDQIYPHPKHRYYSCKKRSYYLLQSVRDDDIRYKQKQHEKLNSEHLIKVKEIKEEKEALAKLRNGFNNIKGELKTTHCGIQMREEQIEDLQIIEEPKDVHLLQEDLENQYAEKQRLEQQKEELVRNLQVESNTFEEFKDKMILKKQCYSDKSTVYLEYQQTKIELEGNKENYCSEKRMCENAVQKEKDNMALVERTYNEAKKDAETCANDALKICPRIDSERSPKTIEALIAETKKIIEENSKCKSKDMKAKYLEKKKTLQRSKENVDYLNHLIEHLQRMVSARFKGYEIILKNTVCMLQYEFIPLLRSIKYSGQIYFCHEKHTLTIQAISSEDTSKSKCNTKDLSGGERSFVQICFLISLWYCVEMPFRILDEYDVFMDSVNRELSFNFILDMALRDTKTQYILFSPLEIPKSEKLELAKIHRMPDPKRTGDL